MLILNSQEDEFFILVIFGFLKIGGEFKGLRILSDITLKTALVLILPFYCDISGSY